MLNSISDIPTMPIDAQMDDPNEDEDLVPLDERRPRRLLDHLRQKDDEFSDSDDEGDGGRRNHARYRDKDSVDSGSHKFGIGGGILTSGHANTHGAGPSAHTTAVQILSSSVVQDMDIDSPPSTGGSGNEDGSSGPAPATEAAEDSKSATSSASRPDESDPKEMDQADGRSEHMSVDETAKADASS
jgi:histone deacetylase 1/2